MSRLLRAMVLMLLVASCGGGNYSAPRNLDNACSITNQRPKILKAMRKSERRWGVPVHVQMATIYQESKFIGNARTPLSFVLGVIPMGRQSSAYGYAQVLDATWKEYKRETGRYSAKRDNINDAADFMGWYMAKSNETLGIPLSDARNQYLAYHQGRSGYANGSYRGKAWLVRIANEVDSRSRRYRMQLQSCGKL